MNVPMASKEQVHGLQVMCGVIDELDSRLLLELNIGKGNVAGPRGMPGEMTLSAAHQAAKGMYAEIANKQNTLRTAERVNINDELNSILLSVGVKI